MIFYFLFCSLNRMHVMEGECEKSSEMVAESAPELITSKTSIMELKLGKEELPSAEIGVPEPPTELPAAVEPVVNGDTNGTIKEEKSDCSESAKSAEQSVTVNGDSAENSVSEECRTKEESVKEEKDDTKERKEVKEAKDVKEVKEQEVKEGSGGCSEEEDRQSVTSSQVGQYYLNFRVCTQEGSRLYVERTPGISGTVHFIARLTG